MSTENEIKKIKVAVFPSGSEVSLEVHRSLRFIRDIELIGFNSLKDYGEAVFENNISNLPFLTDPSFLEKLKLEIIKHEIDFIIPGMDEVGYLLMSNEKDIGCNVVYSNLKVSKIIRRKSLTYEYLKNFLPVPNLFQINELVSSDYPIFTKPDIGYGSHGAFKIEKPEDIEKLTRDQSRDNIFIEYLPGDEITVDCFSDMNGKLLFAGPRIRARVRNGISTSTYPIKLSDEIYSIAKNISDSLKMNGCWFFQLKQDHHGNYKLLEIAARMSGSMAMYRLLGVNFILLDLYQRLGKAIKIPRLISGSFKLERALTVDLIGKIEFDSVYVDLDDCLIINNKINTRLIAFLYSCRNKNIPIFLITRHMNNLATTLNHYRIGELFDNKFHLQNEEPKYTVISHKKAIFIDDSFSEREAVSIKLDIITFAPDMVDEGIL